MANSKDLLKNILDQEVEYNRKYEELYNKKNRFNNSLEQNNREITNIKYKIQVLENNLLNDTSLPNSIRNILNNNRVNNFIAAGTLKKI